MKTPLDKYLKRLVPATLREAWMDYWTFPRPDSCRCHHIKHGEQSDAPCHDCLIHGFDERPDDWTPGAPVESDTMIDVEEMR